MVGKSEVEKKYLALNDITAYKIAFSLSNQVWEIVVKCDHFAKKTVWLPRI